MLANVIPYIQLVGIIAALFGGGIALQSLRLNTRTNKAKFILDLTESFLKDDKVKEFWYKLDYEGDTDREWRFDLANFRHSEEERHLDTLLFRCAMIGQLVRIGAVKPVDLSNIYFLIRQIFCNSQVREYLRFNIMDFWLAAGHTEPQWPDAHYLYLSVLRWHVKKGTARLADLIDYKIFLDELTQVPFDSLLRENIAARIRYDKALDRPRQPN